MRRTASLALGLLAMAGLVMGGIVAGVKLPEDGPPLAMANIIDQQRQDDLDGVQLRLIAYLDEHGNYPSTLNQVQALCRFPEDIGCAVGLQPIRDPLGIDYAWQSDGQKYVLYAQRDGDGPGCEIPDHLKAIGWDKALCAVGW